MLYMKVFVRREVKIFLDSLEKTTQTKVTRMIHLLQEYGQEIGMPHSRPLRDGVFEMRIRGKQEVRLLYGYNSAGAIVVLGFVKKAQRTPTTEIRRAALLLCEYGE